MANCSPQTSQRRVPISLKSGSRSCVWPFLMATAFIQRHFTCHAASVLHRNLGFQLQLGVRTLARDGQLVIGSLGSVRRVYPDGNDRGLAPQNDLVRNARRYGLSVDGQGLAARGSRFCRDVDAGDFAGRGKSVLVHLGREGGR